MKKPFTATAYHEAGHAFAAWHFRFKVKKASIVPNAKDGSAGHVLTKTGLHHRSLEYNNPSGARIGRLHERIVSLMAGHVAQRRYRASSVRPYHAQSDRNAVADVLLSIHAKNELSHVIRYLETRTRNLITKPMHWFVISHLAGELLKRQTMTGEEVESAILEGFKRHAEASENARSCRVLTS